MIRLKTLPGRRYPAGAERNENGTNFSIFSRHATRVELLLYESATSPEPFQIICLDPDVNRTFFSWHVYVEGLPPTIHYTWRVDGRNDTRLSGCRFEAHRQLLDPWARGVTHDLWNRRSAAASLARGNSSMRAVIVHDEFDWAGDVPVDHPMEGSIIYEVHVGGFTRHPSSEVRMPGTFSGIIEKIPYLKELGITDVQLMPIMAFDEQDVSNKAASAGLKNYWGYSTHSFFSPHPGYCERPEHGSHVTEFREMVKALHKADIGVILDVVFNHTAEGGEDGPTINFKGFANEIFYHLDAEDLSRYRDYTGCGNTLNCNHPLVSSFIMSCLEYWVREMHVDGFRFDLASVLTRGEDGTPLQNAPVPWYIEFSEVLSGAKLIAEAWDAAGLYQVGAFPGFRWAEWNGKYRDVVRRFVSGTQGLIAEIATRVAGSSDLYGLSGRTPINSINFVSCHDGFTLWDLVSYNEKHNEDNGEDNRDGTNENFSWNCGIEGETEDSAILALRRKQAKNYVAILLLSQGVPMLLAGDEVLRTQRGNNNAYCQDNEVSWFDWTLTRTNREMLDFVRRMIAFRKRHPCLMRNRFLTGRATPGKDMPDVTWHGLELNKPLWEEPHAQLLAFTLAGRGDREEDLHVIFNMSEKKVALPLPELANLSWFRAVDTARPFPEDVVAPADQLPVSGARIVVEGRSVVVLESRPARSESEAAQINVNTVVSMSKTVSAHFDQEIRR